MPSHYRVRYLIRQTSNLNDELDKLARILSTKYQKDIRIVLREVRRR